jgi:DNA-directed RNA polymerase subunit L
MIVLPAARIPSIKALREDEDVLQFTIYDIDLSFVNAMRRTILSDIAVCHIDADRCIIKKNDGQLHNELIKERLLCIPVHVEKTDLAEFVRDYTLEITICNTSDAMQIVTTNDFRIRNITNNEYVNSSIRQSIFPPDLYSRDYIDFARLLPNQSLVLTSTFGIGDIKKNGAFSATSLCTFTNTIDAELAAHAWNEIKQQLTAKTASEDEILFAKKNYYCMDAQRHFYTDSFDFSVKAVVYRNMGIVQMACDVLLAKLHSRYELTDADETCPREQEIDYIIVTASESTMANAFDIVLVDEGYTLGKVFEYILYTHMYKTQYLTYCGFKQFHPHDANSTIRIAFRDDGSNEEMVHRCRVIMSKAAKYAIAVFGHIRELLSQ